MRDSALVADGKITFDRGGALDRCYGADFPRHEGDFVEYDFQIG